MEKTVQDFFAVINERTSIRNYDPTIEIEKSELTNILDDATKAPSAWNLQHWNFMVFHSDEAKKNLLPIAFNQEQIVDSSAVIAILGDLEANKNIDSVYTPLVKAGYVEKEIIDNLSKQINGAYLREQYPRDAAMSNASLAAMQLMLSAKARGWDTCAIGGFDPEKLMSEFNISDRFVPVMLISVGKALKPSHQSTRLEVEKVTTWK
ncbi:nitroreductase family protein [Bacillus carboniphilus]|uniref:Nitroreductase family protein n=1 Tax=Bacillus carboniphilus TaxID=86663 RepID=A0ABY9JVB6_9BACI|nr:nitroreductase family protein [Bacillus carboniphilus]WLR43339.1 nitroreductase family protein [Bacillus carboniphilus]